METSHFGSILRQARERRQISLAEVAERTKVPQWSLQLIEAGEIDDLPGDVFVRGFIRSYARSVGIADSEPLGLFEEALAARRRAEEALLTTPNFQVADTTSEEDGQGHRRGIGIAVFVIIVLLIATITLSLFLRQPPQSGEGLSLREVPATPAARSRGA
jgi:cytoskeletal protein RodZ